MKLLSNLENSSKLFDRQEYANRLKFYIQKWESEMPEIQRLNQEYPDLKSFEPQRNKEAIKKLKIKLSNYDIYNQKKKCQYCQEFVCVCYEAGIETSDQAVPKELQQGNETQSDARGEDLEDLRRKTGDHSPSIASELPF